ncbi:MAG: TIGR03915 family putative DNA repair protein [Firmicutes bacterium]|nr:TIGR03915 family putative DNA repair protein [Bacillota bacterium]
MINYIYDGTFEGLLTVFSLMTERGEAVNRISAEEGIQPDLFSETVRVETDAQRADEFFQTLRRKFSQPVIEDLGYCFLAEIQGMEKVMADYVRLLLDKGEAISGNFTEPVVFKIRRTCTQVSHEIGRLQGFIRFRKLKNQVYYAPIAPDHNVVQLLAPHFKDRFADQKWLIHDTKRNSGIYYDLERCRFIPAVENAPRLETQDAGAMGEEPGIFDPEELDYQEIWDQYFQEIAIAERRNPKLQKQRMPVRYWRYLVETPGV